MPLAAPTASHAEHTSAHPLPIRIERLTKRYGATLALDALDLPGEDLTVIIYTAPVGSAAQEKLDFLARWAGAPATGRAGSTATVDEDARP